MKRPICTFLFTLILLVSCAHAQTRTYTYGGSGQDILYDAAVSADGRIVLTGQTDSSDGTLASRTKTARSAWALCIDAQGHVLWNYCTRLGSYDTLRYPVFLGDGSVSMLLETSHDGLYEVLWIQLDAQGNEIGRKMLDSRGVPWVIRAGGVLNAYQSGYVIDALNKKTSSAQSFLYTFDGEYAREIDYVQEPYFPKAQLPDGSFVSITNQNEEPFDVLVTIEEANGEAALPEAGFYPFAGDPPQSLQQALMGSPWHGANIVDGYADRLNGSWRYAQMILEDRNGYWLCCGVYDAEKGWQLEASRSALRQDMPPELVPIAVARAHSPDTIRAAGGCDFFEIRYPDVTLLWGYQQQYDRFSLSEATLASGEHILVLGNTLSAVTSAGNLIYHDFGHLLQDFDIVRMPASLAEAQQRASALPQSDRHMARLSGNDSTLPGIAMHEAPDEQSPVIARYMCGVNAETIKEGEAFTCVRIGSLQGYIRSYNVLVGGERAQMEYDTSGAPGLVYGTQSQSLLASAQEESDVLYTLTPASPVEILGRAENTPFLQVQTPDGRVGFMHDTHVLIGWEDFDGYFTLKVVPEGALLYSQPDEGSAPIGQCMAGAQVGRLVEYGYVQGWQRVIIQGYDGYMRAEDLENVREFTVMP